MIPLVRGGVDGVINGEYMSHTHILAHRNSQSEVKKRSYVPNKQKTSMHLEELHHMT